jgi:hypothetical protein
MALEAPTLDRRLFVTKTVIKDGGRRKTVHIYGHFELLLAFIVTIRLKKKLVGKLPHLQGKWLL